MSQENCPKCRSANLYQDRDLWVCPECSREWMAGEDATLVGEEIAADSSVRDIRLADMGDGHSIACKIEGIVAINLKFEFVRKA